MWIQFTAVESGSHPLSLSDLHTFYKIYRLNLQVCNVTLFVQKNLLQTVGPVNILLIAYVGPFILHATSCEQERRRPRQMLQRARALVFPNPHHADGLNASWQPWIIPVIKILTGANKIISNFLSIWSVFFLLLEK